jgi:hypothetical protein
MTECVVISCFFILVERVNAMCNCLHGWLWVWVFVYSCKYVCVCVRERVGVGSASAQQAYILFTESSTAVDFITSNCNSP